MGLEQSMAVNPFGKQVEVDKKPEITEDVTFEISEKVNSVFEEYEKIYSRLKNNPNCCVYMSSFISNLKLDVLLPSEIDLFLQLITVKKGVENFSGDMTGIMILRLINDSYKAGNNNFILIALDNALKFPIWTLNGNENKPIELMLNGNAASCFGYKSSHCRYIINGNVNGELGAESNNCKYTVSSDVQSFCGLNSKNCQYIIKGNAGEYFANCAEGCEFTVYGSVEDFGSGAKDCTFTLNSILSKRRPYAVDCVYKTKNCKTYEQLKSQIVKRNIIILLDDKETEINRVEKK